MPLPIIKETGITNFRMAAMHLAVILAALYASSFHSYVLFHTLAEIVSVVLAMAVFLVAWNARRYWGNSYYILIGFGFLFVGIIDLIHAFEYKGVGIIQSGGDANIATQLWLAGRYLIACSFLAAPFLSHRKLRAGPLFAVFTLVSSLLLLSIFYWKIFPAAYADGSGLTFFKKASEYALIALFLAGFAYFYRVRQQFHDRVFKLLSWVLLIMAFTELSFTLYVGVYDFFNLLGHLLKISAYYLAYLGIVEFGLMKPYHALFKDLRSKTASLRQATNEWNLMFNSITDPTFIIDSNHTVKEVNKAMCDFMGVGRAELIGRKCFEFMHKKDGPWATCPMKATCQGKKPHSEEIYEPTLGKTLLVTTSPILDERGEVIGILHISKDITERKLAEERIRYLSTHDSLTGLYNRRFFEEKLEKFSGRRHFKGGVLMMDINDLKKANDTLGHFAGDELIRRAAGFISDEFREDDVVARIGGDEFCVLLPDMEQEEVEAAARRLQKKIRDAHAGEDEHMRLAISIGAAYVRSGSELKQALIDADARMYQDKLALKSAA